MLLSKHPQHFHRKTRRNDQWDVNWLWQPFTLSLSPTVTHHLQCRGWHRFFTMFSWAHYAACEASKHSLGQDLWLYVMQKTHILMFPQVWSEITAHWSLVKPLASIPVLHCSELSSLRDRWSWHLLDSRGRCPLVRLKQEALFHFEEVTQSAQCSIKHTVFCPLTHTYFTRVSSYSGKEKDLNLLYKDN